MRWTQAFIPTLKESPKDAEIISHQLMIRAGMMRKVGSGIYQYLPLGLRVVRKVEQIVREEMNRTGAQELLMPVLSPAELWKESGRWFVYGKELMRLIDRHEHDYVLGPTHEEIITDLAKKELRSYKDLPVCLYQIQTKFRDEVRPRFGVMRGREFTMKDAYSFHRSQEDLEKYYGDMREAYIRVFDRCGLDTRVVIGHSGAIGGNVAHELMVRAESGESAVLSCPDAACGYAATDETAAGKVVPVETEEKPAELEKVATPDKKTIEEVADFLSIPVAQTIKAVFYQCDEDALAVVFVRGDREVNTAMLHSYIDAYAIEPAPAAFLESKKDTGIVPGYCGPLKISPEHVIIDASVKDVVNGVIGANEDGFHYKNFNAERDLPNGRYYDVVVHKGGDLCPKCGKPMEETRGIEVGNIFQLGTKYSEAMSAKFVDSDNTEKPFIMGCYGIGITRTVAAAIEQNYDKWGILWPRALAPFDILLQPLDVEDKEVMTVTEELEKQLTDAGYDLLVDDRDAKPGFKFKDADLIGIPLRVTISARSLPEGKLEIKRRCDDKPQFIAKDGAFAAIEEAYASCP